MTRVVNIHKEKYDVLIDRTTVFGNLFPEWKWGREECIRKFETYFYLRLERDPEWKAKVIELRGKVLGCHCKQPQKEVSCHGDVYVAYFEAYDEVERARLTPLLQKILADIDILATDHGWYEPELQEEAFYRISETKSLAMDAIVAKVDLDHDFDVIGAINEYLSNE